MIRDLRILYKAKNNKTGLIDVMGEFYLNDIPVAVGGSGLSFSELDSVHSPGVYFCHITAVELVTWGAISGGTNTLEVWINSASFPAPAIFKQDLVFNNADDLSTQIVDLQSDIMNNVEGAGFSNSTDSLHEISLYMRDNLFLGGKAI